jgi:hypothetical protein
MKQKQVAEQLDWTAAKTSQVVGDLRDEDTRTIDRRRRRLVVLYKCFYISPTRATRQVKNRNTAHSFNRP